MDMINQMMQMPDSTDGGQAPKTPNLAGIMTQAPGDFKGLTTAAQINTVGLHSNPALGRLQLSQRLQDKFGQGYDQNEQAQAILKAYDGQSKSPTAFDQMDLNQSMAKAGRTLGAIIGG